MGGEEKAAVLCKRIFLFLLTVSLEIVIVEVVVAVPASGGYDSFASLCQIGKYHFDFFFQQNEDA